MNIRFPRSLNKMVNKEEISQSVKEVIHRYDSYSNSVELIGDRIPRLIVADVNFNNSKDIEKYIIRAFNEKKNLIFYNCCFTEAIIKPRHFDLLGFYKCTFEKITFEYDCERSLKEVSRVQFVNSKLNDLVTIKNYNEIFLFDKSEMLGESFLDFKNCTRAKIYINDLTEDELVLNLENSEAMELFLLANNFIPMFDNESCKFKIFLFYPNELTHLQYSSLRNVTRNFYLHLKSKHDEDRFYYYKIYKELDRKTAYGFEYLSKSFISLLTGYFISPFRIFLTSIGVIVFFAVVYLYAGIQLSDGSIIKYVPDFAFELSKEDLFKSIYLSIITFSTVGYGNLVPMESGEIFACIQMLIGASYFGFFTGTIFNRYVE